MRKLQAQAPARAAGTDGQTTIGEATHDSKVTSVSYIPDAAITGANTDTRRLSLVNRGQAGTGTTEIAALSFIAGVNAAENDEKAFTLHATHANREVAKGDVLELVSDSQGSTGLADPGGVVQVEIQ